MVDKYLEPASASKNVSVGMGLCLDLSILYLEQHRLDDAEKLFDRLAKVPDVRPYRTLGRLGGAIVLALRDRAPESNKAFRDIIATDPLLADVARHTKENKVERGKEKKAERAKENKIEPEFRKMWANPSFRYWLARAINSNLRNGVPREQTPAAVLRWSKPPEPKS